jgi:signal transduction histidine kinase
LLLTSDRYEIAVLRPRQAVVLLTGLLLPWFGLTLQVLGLNALSLMPLAFTLSTIVVAVYALGFRALKKTPLERHLLLNNLDDGLLVLDKRHTVVDANAAAELALERPLSGLIGQPLTAIWPELAGQFHRLQERPLDLIREVDGAHHFYEVRLSPLYDWRKTASTHLLLLHDITRRKEQETLREDITNSMVHDLRSPISNSLFALQMLKGTLAEGQVSPDSQQLVEMTFNNTEKMLQLVNNILDVNQLENGRVPIKPTSICLNTLTNQVITTHSAYALEKGVSVECQIAADLPPAWADVGLVERVLQNLLHNSLKFTPVGGHVWITAVLAPANANCPPHLEISVHDDGPGLPSTLQGVIFDKFVTGDNKQSGNGLGLAFCQMALAAHGERIWVHSTPGQGATFTFTLSPASPPPVEVKLGAEADVAGEVKTAVADPPATTSLNGLTLSRPHPKMAFLNR